MRKQPIERMPHLLSSPTDSPEYWTSVLRRAGPIARSQRDDRPCSYRPWQLALKQIGAEWIRLMDYAATACGPGWPADHAALIEFAFAFLEEDPMLMRSGYTKRHFAKRLGQYPLSSAQIARLHTIFTRAVIEGAGLEEFGAYCRLAATLRPIGLEEWLIDKAAGARLRSYTVHNSDFSQLHKLLSLEQYSQLAPTKTWGNPKCAVTFNPDPSIHPMTEEDWADPANKTRVNAWRMLGAIQRRNSHRILVPLASKASSDSRKRPNA